MSNKIPSRINGKKNPEYHRDYNKKYRNTQDPILKRERNRESSRKYREENREKWNEYLSKYWKKYYQENKEIHAIRNKTGAIKQGLLVGAKFAYENRCILSNLRAVGWSENLPDTKCIGHRISIYWFVKFCRNIPAIVVYDVDNIEVIDRVENNSASKREVNDASLVLASKLERKYKKELKGFTSFLSKYKGKVK